MKLSPKISHITFTTPPSKEVVKMINKLVKKAAKIRPATDEMSLKTRGYVK